MEKSPSFMGKSSISMAMFNSFLLTFTRGFASPSSANFLFDCRPSREGTDPPDPPRVLAPRPGNLDPIGIHPVGT